MKIKEENAITLVALVVTLIILLVLAGITIATLGGENGLIAKVNKAKKAHIQSEMQEQLTLALNELQLDKKGNASLDDVTQEWISSVISSDYNPIITEDASIDGKLVVMNKSDVTGKFLINQNLEINKTEYNVSTLEFEYKTVKIENGKVQILIKITDKINGINQVDYPDPSEKSLIMQSRKDLVGIDYSVELGKEYKFVITTGDGNKTEKTIKIEDYFYNITKSLGESATIDNNATKAAYNKTYETTVSAEGNYAITGLTVTMGGQPVTTSGNNVVDVNTGKIKIEKVTGDINITVTTKKLEIQYTTVAVSKSNSSTATSSEEANTIEKGTPLYINIIATIEGKSCKVVLKADNSKEVPYQVTTNGKYTFKVSGTYNNKTISEDKEITINQYMSAQGAVKYDAGNWTKEEIEDLQGQNLYMINKEKTYNETFNLNDSNSGLNLTFGGFTYEGDTKNTSAISSGDIITSRNQSVSCYNGDIEYKPSYSGWQILESEEKNGKTYVKKITHAGSPENFAYYYKTSRDNRRVEYLLSSGMRQTEYGTLSDKKTVIKPRSWQMYVDKNQKGLIANTTDKNGNSIKDIHLMTYDEAYEITNSISLTDGVRNIGVSYWLATADTRKESPVWHVKYDGTIAFDSRWGYCWGIRPVISLTSGVYIKAGTGTDADPYILEKVE